MWYKIHQQKCPKWDKEPVRREILLELDDETYELATKLGIEIVIELGDTLVAIIGSFNQVEITAVARLSIPGLDLGDNELPTIQEACHAIIRIANEGKASIGSGNLYRWRDRTESGTGRLGSNPPVRRKKRKATRTGNNG